MRYFRVFFNTQVENLPYLYFRSFRRALLNHFISKVVHDLFCFRREVLATGPRLRQVRFGYFCLICYCTCAETATVVLLALILYKIKLSVPAFVPNLSFGRVLNHSGHL